MNKFIIRPLSFLTLLVFVFCGCSNGTKLKHDLDKELQKEASAKIIYRIPSPIEIVNLLKVSKLDYYEEVLNPMGNWENYTDLHSQSINLGVYSADLSYTAAYEQFQQSALYFSLIKKLAEKVGIAALFSEKMTARVKNNLTNSDSLRLISNLYYRKMVDYLADNDKLTELTMVYVGGWVEVMYILTNTIDTSAYKDLLVQEIADQKLIADNLDKLLKISFQSTDIKSTYKDLKPIFELFQNLEVEEQKPLHVVKNSSDEIIIRGGISYIINEKQVQTLKTEITKIRNKWIKL